MVVVGVVGTLREFLVEEPLLVDMGEEQFVEVVDMSDGRRTSALLIVSWGLFWVEELRDDDEAIECAGGLDGGKGG